MDGVLADDEESDWDDLDSEDMDSDTSDDMEGLDPVEPNPAYQGESHSPFYPHF